MVIRIAEGRVKPSQASRPPRQPRRMVPIPILTWLLAGPGNVCQGLGIAMIDNGRDLLDESLLIATLPGPTQPVAQSARIGITRDVERPWRFIDPTSKSLSGPKLPHRASI